MLVQVVKNQQTLFGEFIRFALVDNITRALSINYEALEYSAKRVGGKVIVKSPAFMRELGNSNILVHV